ncbi:MAG TPA: prepilin-type N-terminal cleavage/methylation domain-containing protein [Kofleriaceae bacterium]
MKRRGFTLIELMVAMLVSALLVAMILAIFTRMSVAYRSQQQVADLQQVLAAARAQISQDAMQSGLECPQGFKLATDGYTAYAGPPLGAPVRHQPVVVTNSSTGPDEIAFFYADTSKQAAVTGAGWAGSSAVAVDSASGFAIGDLVLMSTPDLSSMSSPTNPGIDANIAKFDACVLRVSGVSAQQLTFDETAPWGIAASSHCVTPSSTTMVYRFIAHAYRIDPTRPTDGVLQVSYTGGLLGNAEVWQDLALGFTDLQTAVYFYDGDAIDTPDPDTDPARDWYSSSDLTTMTSPILASSVSYISPLMMSVSLVVRTDREVEGVSSVSTPQLTDPLNPSNNVIGDRPAIDLTTTSDPALLGAHIYRYTTFQVDLRNIGVGR